MAENSLYPGFVKLFYNSNGHQHIAKIPVDPYVGVGGEYGLNYPTPGPGAFPWTVGIDAYVAVLRPLLNTNATINRAELWTVATPTSTPIYRSTHEIELAGLQAGTPNANVQQLITFRTNLGGRFRAVVLEGVFAANIESFPPLFNSTATRAWSDFITGGSSWLRGRDGGYPTVAIRMLTKTNDTLRKKYILDS